MMVILLRALFGIFVRTYYEGFCLASVLILLTIIILTVNVALQDLGQTGLSYIFLALVSNC